MKKYLTVLIIMVAMTCFSFATTGGPDFIKATYYDSKHHSIWYIKEYYDGGSGIKIIEYMIKNHNTKTITNIAGIQYETDDSGRIYDITSDEAEKVLVGEGLEKLQSVHINKMPLYFTLSAHNFEIYTDDLTTYISNTPKKDMYRVNRRNKIYVNNQLQNITNITTCGLDPMNYRGLSLPGKNFVVIIETSERRNCDEGGYIGEELFVVKYLRMYKRYFIGPHSDLYGEIIEENRAQDSHYNEDTDLHYYDTHDYFGVSGPLQPSLGGLYIKKLSMSKENIIKKR